MKWTDMEIEQPTVMTMLRQAIRKDRLSHAYIFEGMHGSKKEDVALLMAQSIFCARQTEGRPCETCVECKRIAHGNHPDVMLLHPDGESIKKAQVEALQKEFTYKGMEAGTKVYLVHKADTMTASAGNSLLKFLEEPASPTMAVLLTENAHFLLPTIQSRAQRISFAPPLLSTRTAYFEEQGMSPASAGLLARLPDDTLDNYEEESKEWIVQGRALVIQLVNEVNQRPQQALLTLQEKWLVHFKDRKELDIGLDLLLFWYRDLLSVQKAGGEFAYPDQMQKLESQALSITEQEIAASMQLILDAKRRLRANVNNQLLMEQLVLHLQEGS